MGEDFFGLTGPAPKPYDPYVPSRMGLRRYRPWEPPGAPPLPWGEQEVQAMQQTLHRQINEFVVGVPLVDRWSRTSSAPAVWKVSPERAQVMKDDADAWIAQLEFIPDHKAEAIRIVYEGMLAAGVVPASAQRKPRGRYHG